jgi:hypothetical protein
MDKKKARFRVTSKEDLKLKESYKHNMEAILVIIKMA